MAIPHDTSETDTYVVFVEDGKITLPTDILVKLGFEEGSAVSLRLVEDAIQILPTAEAETSPGGNPIAEVYDWFAPTRAHVLAQGYSEDEINADIDAAIAEVRAEARARGS